MMGIWRVHAFLEGFMGYEDWRGCCETFTMPTRKNLFWPIPITLSAEEDYAKSITPGTEVALWDTETEAIMGTMKVTEKYTVNKEYECQQIFKTNDPGPSRSGQKVMEQGAVESGRTGGKSCPSRTTRKCVQGHLSTASSRSPRGICGTRLEYRRSSPTPQSHAQFACLPGLDRQSKSSRRRVHSPVGRGKPETRRHPRRNSRQSYRRSGQQVFPARIA